MFFVVYLWIICEENWKNEFLMNVIKIFLRVFIVNMKMGLISVDIKEIVVSRFFFI